MTRASILFAGLLLCAHVATCFYLPGVAPHEYQEKEPVPVKVNKMVSDITQLPFEYYSLNFCRPSEGVKVVPENLGEILVGDRIENTPYQVRSRVKGKEEASEEEGRWGRGAGSGLCQ